MALYRCNNCGTEFEADRPHCAKCDVSADEDPRFANVITPLVTLHFDPPSKVKNIGLGRLACDPTKGVAGSRATGEPSVVNCKKCRQTEAWKKAAAAAGLNPTVPPDLDVAAQASPDGLTVPAAP